MSSNACKSVGIVGAGIQGVCIGLQLLKKIFQQLFLTRKIQEVWPSYGNAGHFSPYAILQLNRPDVLYDVPKMLFSSYGPLALKWNYVPKMIPWFFGYLKTVIKNQ